MVHISQTHIHSSYFFKRVKLKDGEAESHCVWWAAADGACSLCDDQCKIEWYIYFFDKDVKTIEKIFVVMMFRTRSTIFFFIFLYAQKIIKLLKMYFFWKSWKHQNLIFSSKTIKFHQNSFNFTHFVRFFERYWWSSDIRNNGAGCDRSHHDALGWSGRDGSNSYVFHFSFFCTKRAIFHNISYFLMTKLEFRRFFNFSKNVHFLNLWISKNN